MSEQTTSSKKITVGLILSWIFGVLFALTGIVSVFSEPVPGFVMLVMAAVLLPPITKLVDQKWKFHLSKGMKIGVIVIGLIIFSATVDTSNVSNTQQTETNEQKDNETETIPTSDEEKAEASEETKPTTPADTDQSPIPTKIEDKPEPTLSETVSQKNAVRSAKAYLDYSAFSREGLVAQLEYEQFSHADAVYGTDNSGANWNEQAAKNAKQYIEYSAFSRGSLIDQLKHDKFTQEQAEYGTNAVGL